MAEGFGTHRRATTATNATVLVALATAVVIVLNLIVSQSYVRWDWTSDAVMKLSQRTHTFIDGLEKPVNIYVFYAPPAAYGPQSTRADEVYQVHHLAREYDLASDLITLQTLDPDSDRGRADDLRTQFQISRQELAMGVVVFEYQGRVRYATDQHLFVTDLATLEELRQSGRPVAGAPRLFQGEDVFTSAISTLVTGGLPSVALLAGQGQLDPGVLDPQDPESAARSCARLRQALQRATFEVDVLDLKGNSQINKAYDCILVTGPTEPLPATSIKALERYVEAGGNLVILVHPHIDVRPDGQVPWYDHGLDAFLKEWGVEAAKAMVLMDNPEPGGIRLASAFFSPRLDKDHPVTRTMGGDPPHRVEFRLARAVHYDDRGRNKTLGQPIARTDPSGIAVDDLTSFQAATKAGPEARRKFLGGGRYTPGEHTVGVALMSVAPAGDGDQTRMVVLGSRSFATDAQQGFFDMDLLLNAVNWCAKREDLIGIGPKDARKVRFALEAGELNSIFFFSVVGLPLAIGLLGVLVWWVRRREGDTSIVNSGAAAA